MRTVAELVINEMYYEEKYSDLIGPIKDAIHRACLDNSFSELYELAALANVLQLEIHSVYPYIDYRAEMKNMNSVYRPMRSLAGSHDRLVIFWSSDEDELSTKLRPGNRGIWNPKHFVPLVYPYIDPQTVK